MYYIVKNEKEKISKAEDSSFFSYETDPTLPPTPSGPPRVQRKVIHLPPHSAIITYLAVRNCDECHGGRGKMAGCGTP